MFESISFCVGDKTIEINGNSFDLGALTTEVLNIPKSTYEDVNGILKTAYKYCNLYEQSKDLSDWFKANEEFIKLDDKLMKYNIFRLIKQEPYIFEETRQFTSQLTLFSDVDCELTENDLELSEQIASYVDYLKHPENYGGEDIIYLEDEQGELHEISTPKPPIPDKPREKTSALLIYPGDINLKWEFYKHYCEKYEAVIYDVVSFNNTIYNFIKYYLSNLKKLNANNYAEALMRFLNNPSADKLIANPIRETGLFMNSDSLTVRHIPRETEKGSGVFKIYEYYEVELLQAFLKVDFYKSLQAGYIIRKCEYCGRYFLLKKAYHTKYCDLPNPDDPKHTCAQLGYHYAGVKEAVGDNPKAQALRRCCLRIDKDFRRGIISADEKQRLYDKAKDLLHTARVNPNVSNDKFEKSLESKNLYPLCNVVRKTNPRGRPKAKK